MFIATLTYELHPSTESDAKKLLRAELVGRRWQDRCNGVPMPANTVWAKRTIGKDETTDTLQARCAHELYDAIASVARTGRAIALKSAWVHVSGSGTYGLVAVPRTTET